MSSARSTNSMGTPANSMHNVRAVVECARARRRDAGALMSDERGCGRDADSNTRDVTSGAVIARWRDLRETPSRTLVHRTIGFDRQLRVPELRQPPLFVAAPLAASAVFES